MHTAEEVRAIAAAWVDDDPKLHEMLLAYADLLEAKTAEAERLSALAVSFMAAVDKVRGYIDSTVSEGASADILAPLDAVMDVAKALAATRKG